ncbi:MAG: 2-oxoacid:acceptor oxidoreductase family protein [Desulfobacteraceae bacterium]|nr:2-oxoacid:acceptor oxidoreductase family protein [Desulfobacteraceae bacterium]
MKEIKIHGRGGQGAAVAARILTTALVYEGKWASGFPVFGVERRGAPLTAFVRLDDKPIREKTKIYSADSLIVIDPYFFHSSDVFQGIREDCILVVNSPVSLTEQYHKNLRVIGSVDATEIAVQEIGRPITNTCMLGAFARSTAWVQLDSLLSALEEYFQGDILERNIKAVARGFEETRVTAF